MEDFRIRGFFLRVGFYIARIDNNINFVSINMDALRDEIKKLREDFTKGTLTEADVKVNPFEQFEIWLAEAVEAKIPEVQATTLSTVTADGKPSSRIVYMREFENNNFFIYSNYNSQKAIHISKNNNVTLNLIYIFTKYSLYICTGKLF